MSRAEPVLCARGVEAKYGERPVVRGVDLEVSPGELWVILGPNGAGKSTFLRTLLGLHPLSAGALTLFGRPIAHWSRPELAKKVAWVPQAFEPAFGFTGLELVTMGRSPHLGAWGLPSHRDVARAREVMQELGLAELAARPATLLSGGEQRLLLLARAIVQAPELLLLDEPTAFLDLRHQVETLRTVRERTRAGLAAVAVLHDVNLASAYADRVLLLQEGRVLASGPTREVLQGSTLEALYGVPMIEVAGAGGQPVFAPRFS
ncbi:MAG: ABC transporter ATP-binding protein [Myxococcaceae bacterium]|nr:ABC transporter ATP-binding protein [Myxococcaceae bacterium]